MTAIVVAVFLGACGKPTEAEIAREAMPGVVTIRVFDGNGKASGGGSGFILAESGLVGTNHHVIDGAAKAEVILANQDTHPIDGIVYMDADKDFAILKISAVGLRPLMLADSEKVESGQKVIAIGSPLGLDQSLTVGFLSQVRSDGGRRVIQHSASISPGSSGGPLLNDVGEVLGLNTFLIEGGQSLSFALPINYLKPFLDRTTVSKTIEAYYTERRPKRHSLKIVNSSSYDITRIYVSATTEDNWGPDQLGTNVLGVNRSFELSDITPGSYDVKFVDEDDDTCILRNISIAGDATWTITSEWLLNCEFN